MRRSLLASGVVLLFMASSVLAGEVVVLKGGARIELAQPPVRQGSNVLLTRADGTLFSVPDAEVDWKATAAARQAPSPKPAPAFAAPPETPAEAARLGREGPKARVKITDADVNHEVALSEEKKESEGSTPASPGTARLEVSDYTQEKSGASLVVRGNLRNIGATSALNVSMSVTALDDGGKGMGSASASLSKGVVESGRSVSFSAALPVGDKVPASIRFSPVWTPVPPSAAPGAAAAPAAPAPGYSPAPAETGSRPSSAPPPAPTPYGMGLMWAAPSAPAASAPSADGKTGYIPGAARKEDQPKPPQ